MIVDLQLVALRLAVDDVLDDHGEVEEHRDDHQRHDREHELERQVVLELARQVRRAGLAAVERDGPGVSAPDDARRRSARRPRTRSTASRISAASGVTPTGQPKRSTSSTEHPEVVTATTTAAAASPRTRRARPVRARGGVPLGALLLPSSSHGARRSDQGPRTAPDGAASGPATRAPTSERRLSERATTRCRRGARGVTERHIRARHTERIPPVGTAAVAPEPEVSADACAA